MTWKRRVRSPDLDAVGGLVAAGLAVMLHLLELIEQDALLVVLTSLVALLLFRDLQQEMNTEELSESVASTERNVAEIRAAMTPPDVELVNPSTPTSSPSTETEPQPRQFDDPGAVDELADSGQKSRTTWSVERAKYIQLDRR